MPGLVPGIHVFLCCRAKDVDGRDKPGHDDVERSVPASVGMTRRAIVLTALPAERPAARAVFSDIIRQSRGP